MSKIQILDGSMGQELVKRVGDLNKPMWGIGVMDEAPELVRAVHDDYFAAGAEIATTNTYNIHEDRFIRDGVPEAFERLHHLACRLAVEARDAHGGGLVAGSMGPLGGSYRPDRGNDIDAAATIYERIARVQADFVDFYIIETVSSLDAARGAVAGAATAGKPVWLAFTVDDDDGAVIRSGERVEEAGVLADQLGVDAVLINCSRPEAVTEAVRRLRGVKALVGAYANGFTRISEEFRGDKPEITMLEERKDLNPAAYAQFAKTWRDDGAAIIGGCCEVGPAHIAELARRLT